MTGLGLHADVAANTSRIVDIREADISDEERTRSWHAQRASVDGLRAARELTSGERAG